LPRVSGRRSLPGRIADRIALRRGALHERRLQDDYLARTGRRELDAWFAERHGTTVLHGPLAGLRYPPEVIGRVYHLTAKLLGTYEQELAGVIAQQAARRPPLFADLGAADGYYAVGFARASPSTAVRAFEVDPVAKRVLRALAHANDVEGRVSLQGPANTRRLAELPLEGAFVLCDIEGAEVDVLDPDAVPGLARATLLVEVHPLDGGGESGAALRERFAPTHSIEAIEPRERDSSAHPELDGAPHRAEALDELRFGRGSWLVLRPR
jgi:hypothetical protein